MNKNFADLKAIAKAASEDAADAIAHAYHDADQRARIEAAKVRYDQALAAATAHYPAVADMVADTVRRNAAALGLLPPATAEQVAVCNGTGITSDGAFLFRVVVKRRTGDIRSRRELGTDIQNALDVDCFGNGYARLVLLRVVDLGGNWAGLELTWGNW